MGGCCVGNQCVTSTQDDACGTACANCAQNGQVCDTAAGTCAPCSALLPCANGCCQEGQCVSTCSSATPYCVNASCVVCITGTNTGCSAPTPLCELGTSCVQCFTAFDCPAHQACFGGSCTGMCGAFAACNGGCCGGGMCQPGDGGGAGGCGESGMTCSDCPDAGTDSGTVDSGHDTGVIDTGVADTGVADTGTTDTGATEAGDACHSACSPGCTGGQSCCVDGDCLSLNCMGPMCGPPACAAQHQCSAGHYCDGNPDCFSGVCTAHVCALSSSGGGCGQDSDCCSNNCNGGNGTCSHAQDQAPAARTQTARRTTSAAGGSPRRGRDLQVEHLPMKTDSFLGTRSTKRSAMRTC